MPSQSYITKYTSNTVVEYPLYLSSSNKAKVEEGISLLKDDLKAVCSNLVQLDACRSSSLKTSPLTHRRTSSSLYMSSSLFSCIWTIKMNVFFSVLSIVLFAWQLLYCIQTHKYVCVLLMNSQIILILCSLFFFLIEWLNKDEHGLFNPNTQKALFLRPYSTHSSTTFLFCLFFVFYSLLLFL